jgi:hypothetical protein
MTQNKECSKPTTFPKIRRVVLDNFSTTCDDELTKIINRFTGLEYIGVGGTMRFQCTSWLFCTFNIEGEKCKRSSGYIDLGFK